MEDIIKDSLATRRIKYNCDICNKMVHRLESHSLNQTLLPKYLIFLLMRYIGGNTGSVYKVTKNNTMVKTGIEENGQIMLTIQDQKYQLKSLILHDGEHVHEGHYTAVTYSDATNSYYLINDTYVSANYFKGKTAMEAAKKTNGGYILFYEKIESQS
jgi:uncharacterized UBP type Zn finger protein